MHYCGGSAAFIFLLYPPVPATEANNPKPMVKRNGNHGLSNRIINIFERVDFFIKPLSTFFSPTDE